MINEQLWHFDDDCHWGLDVDGSFMGTDTFKAPSDLDMLTSQKPCDVLYKSRHTKEYGHEVPMKRIKLEPDLTDTTKDMTIQITQSQNHDHIGLLLNIKQEEAISNELSNLLEAKRDNEENLLKHFTSQIECLEGERSKINERIAELVKQRDENPVIIKKQMEMKILELTEQVHTYSKTQSELLSEIISLKENSWTQKQNFLEEISKEEAAKRDLINKLEDRIRKQEIKRSKDREESLKLLHKELEKLRNEKEKEIQELKKRKRRSQQKKLTREQQLNERIKTLLKEKEEMVRSLNKANTSAVQSIQDLLRVSTESSEKITSLKEQLEQETNRSAALEQEKKTLVENLCERVEHSSRRSVSTKLEELGNLVENELQCVVCSELLVAPVTLNCSHTFCRHCISQWKKNKNDCPVCRTRIKAQCKSLILATFIEKIMQNLGDDMKKKREDTLKTRKEEQAASRRAALREPHIFLVSRGDSTRRQDDLQMPSDVS